MLHTDLDVLDYFLLTKAELITLYHCLQVVITWNKTVGQHQTDSLHLKDVRLCLHKAFLDRCEY